MQALFSSEFSQNQFTELFTIYQISKNLFQAKSSSQVIVLWKTKDGWDGATNEDEPVLIVSIGKAIDKHLSI